MRYLKFFILLCHFQWGLQSQVIEIQPPEDIKSITFGTSPNASGLPIINIHDRLYLEFDVLNNLEEDFYYTIEHFDYDWTPSKLMKQEYLEGLDNMRIVNYENSFNTYQIYSHYRLQIPNAQTRLKVSGNYLIKIFDDYDQLVFSRKFMVMESVADVGVQIRRSRDVSLISSSQSVDFSVSPNGFNFNNPMETIKTTIIQNNNLKTAIEGLKPQYILGNKLVFRYNNAALFWGGNEYLFFENKDVRGTNLGVQYIDLQDLYHSYLYTDVERFRQKYTYNPDINGGFKITILDRDEPSIEADYTYVHFSLLADELFESSIYVFGGFNNFSATDENKMWYNSNKGVYECTMLMKQGFYNYKYVVIDHNNNLQEGAISGNFDVTENNYKVVVYYKDLGARYDRLIGMGEANSTQMTN
ncbi:MAG: DUF5103 domain-containing protein [Flavobacteriaceae bacterium]